MYNCNLALLVNKLALKSIREDLTTNYIEREKKLKFEKKGKHNKKLN